MQMLADAPVMFRPIAFPLHQVLQLGSSTTTLLKAVIQNALYIEHDVSIKHIRHRGLIGARRLVFSQQRYMENWVACEPLEVQVVG